MKCLCGDGGSGGTVVDHVRLFRNRPENRWKYRVHEQILPALKTTGTDIRWTDIVIHHVGYQDPALTRRKLERNLRLLHLDFAEHPDDPYILFHLGWANLEIGNVPDAFPFLHRSLQLSHSADSIVKKLYALLVQAHSRLGQRTEALAACRAGRARCPGDPELLYLEGQLLRDTGQLDAAIGCFRRLVVSSQLPVASEEGVGSGPLSCDSNQTTGPLATSNCQLATAPSFGSVEVGFTGYLARNQLAHLYYAKAMHAEAEAEWRRAVEERPDFLPAWLGLGELYLAQGRLEEVDQVVEQILSPSRERERPEPENNEALILKARAHLARKEFEPARRAILEELSPRNPRWVYPKVILSHVLLQEGKDSAAAERVLREIVDLDPSQAESWRNLAVLFRHQGKLAQAAGVCRSARMHCPHDLDLLFLQGIVLRENGELSEAETCLVSVISQVGPDAKGRQRSREARHHLALLYVQVGRFTEAEAQWLEILAECPDHAAARQGLDSLQRQRNDKQEVLAAVS